MATTVVLAVNATRDSFMPPQLSDAALGGIIGGAVAGLVLFLAVTTTAIYCVQRRRRQKLDSPESSIDPFTYVRQVNHRDGNWTLPAGSTLLADPSTPPGSSTFGREPFDHRSPTTDLHVSPEVDDLLRASLSQPEANGVGVVTEKETPTRNSCSKPEAEKPRESEPASETGFRVMPEPKTGSGSDLRNKPEPLVANGTVGSVVVEQELETISGTGLWNELEPEFEVAETETGSRDGQSTSSSLDLSLSEDYCNRVIDEAFLAIDNFAYSDHQSEAE